MPNLTVAISNNQSAQIPILYEKNVFCVTHEHEYQHKDGGIIPVPLGRFVVSHVPSGRAIFATFKLQNARGFCRWLAKWLPDYDPANPDHEEKRIALHQDMQNVARSFK